MSQIYGKKLVHVYTKISSLNKTSKNFTTDTIVDVQN